jgi:hypothetical protein
MEKFNKGNWNVGDSFDLDKASDQIDDRMRKKLVEDLRK